MDKMRVLSIILCSIMLLTQNACCCVIPLPEAKETSQLTKENDPNNKGMIDYVVEMKQLSTEMQEIQEKIGSNETQDPEEIYILEEELAEKAEKIQQLQEEFVESPLFKDLEKSNNPMALGLKDSLNQFKKQKEAAQQMENEATALQEEVDYLEQLDYESFQTADKDLLYDNNNFTELDTNF